MSSADPLSEGSSKSASGNEYGIGIAASINVGNNPLGGTEPVGGAISGHISIEVPGNNASITGHGCLSVVSEGVVPVVGKANIVLDGAPVSLDGSVNADPS